MAAKKAAAPKNKNWKPDPVLEALKKATAATGFPGDDAAAPKAIVIGPIAEKQEERRADTIKETELEATTTKKDKQDREEKTDKNDKTNKKDKKRKKGKANAETPAAGAEAEPDSEAEREKRKREKREKREARDRTERRRLEREERDKAIELASRAADRAMAVDGEEAAPPAPGAAADGAGTGDDDEDNEDEAMDGSADAEAEAEAGPSTINETRVRSPSPPPLQAFPLPRSAPAPDAAVLARQGLPAGLEDAVFIDQDLRVKVDELEIPKTFGKDSALSERMKGRLKDIGIDDFFAGALTMTCVLFVRII